MAMTDDSVFEWSGRWLRRSLLLYVSVLGMEALACVVVAGTLWGTAGVELSSWRLKLTGFSLMAMAACGIAQFAVFVAVAVLFLRLLYKSAQKARGFSTPFTYVSPGWAVGYWFIPLMNLYRPLEVVKALFKACAAESGADAKPKAGEQLLGAWWAVFLLGNIAATILARSDNDFSTTDGVISYVEYDFGVNLLLIAGTLLFAMVVNRLVEAISGAGKTAAPNPA
jgi:hypothetical protein